MLKRTTILLFTIILLISLLGACAAPPRLPEGPTPIPTLIPATMPSSELEATEVPSFTILSYPGRLPSARAGQDIYADQCASCHGESGEGVVPGARNFSDLDYMRGETPASFYATVTEGRGDMPSFQDKLPSDDRWDVVFYVWRFSTDGKTLSEGKKLYEANCVACHGTDGAGVVLGAADLTEIRHVSERAPRDFYLVITQGIGSMPAWQGRLSQEERWAVIDYLRTFSYDPAIAGESTADSSSSGDSSSGDTAGDGEPTTCDLISQTNPFSWDDAEVIAAGKVTFDQACSMCHGADGSGLIPGAPDMTAAAFQNTLHNNGGELLCVVAEGRNAMPGWKETLSTEEIWQVLTYLGSLAAE